MWKVFKYVTNVVTTIWTIEVLIRTTISYNIQVFVVNTLHGQNYLDSRDILHSSNALKAYNENKVDK